MNSELITYIGATAGGIAAERLGTHLYNLIMEPLWGKEGFSEVLFAEITINKMVWLKTRATGRLAYRKLAIGLAFGTATFLSFKSGNHEAGYVFATFAIPFLNGGILDARRAGLYAMINPF